MRLFARLWRQSLPTMRVREQVRTPGSLTAYPAASRPPTNPPYLMRLPMHRSTLALVITAGLITTMPGVAPQARAAVPSTHRPSAPLQAGSGSIKDLQIHLDERGFSPGEADGLWGPKTAAALRRFQAANNLQTSGRLDHATVAALSSNAVAAATPGAAPRSTAAAAAGAPAAVQPAPALAAVTNHTLGTNAAGSNSDGSNAGTSPAKGDDNQAVATTNANSPQPAHGANSFSKGEAGRRISRHGFRDVNDLHKDDTGVWRGTANKDGQHVQVWLDYKGDVGQQ